MVNQKLLLAFNNYTVFGVFLVALSIISYFLVVIFESEGILKMFESLEGVSSHMLSSPMMYFALLFLVVFVYVLEKLLYYGAELKDKSNE